VANSTLSVDLYVGARVQDMITWPPCHPLLRGRHVALVPLTATAPSRSRHHLLFVNGFWVVMVLSFICARFRDVELLCATWCSSPFRDAIFWNYRQISSNRQFIVEYNLHSISSIIRSPLLGKFRPSGITTVWR
jgi:ABC-2 type transport system permease protein/lipopolysaccharide transport system permease protein